MTRGAPRSRVSSVRSGDVLELPDGDRIRVLIADEHEVMYDAWWPHLRQGQGGWGFAGKRSVCYYRTTLQVVKKARRHEPEPLTADETAIHRPDLPLRTLRGMGWTWSNEAFATPVVMRRAAAERGIDLGSLARKVVIDAPKVVVTPCGRRSKRTVTLSADNGRAFDGLELLWKVHELQRLHHPCRVEGAGLYRLGIQGKVPSFYVWGEVDKAGHAL